MKAYSFYWYMLTSIFKENIQSSNLTSLIVITIDLKKKKKIELLLYLLKYLILLRRNIFAYVKF